MDVRHRDLEFNNGNWVLLKVSPIKGVMLFGKKGKLSPRYFRPYLVLKRVGIFFYEMELPPSLLSIHLVFHVSMLRKYVDDPLSIFPLEGLVILNFLSYELLPVEIFDHQVR